MASTIDVIELYGGPGGWSIALRALGLRGLGIEWDAAACSTRAAAGHLTIRADVAALPLDRFVGRARGLIASPPCQSFSAAGRGAGRVVLDALCAAVRRGGWWEFQRAEGYGHVLEVGRWAEGLRPEWIACEQVPPVLPVWKAYRDRWREMGWSAWCGILNAADYGVPQTRQRAFLIARPDGRPVHPPAATHARGGAETLFGQLATWVTMADALGWGATDRPYVTIAQGTGGPSYDFIGGSGGRSLMFAEQASGAWAWRRPSTTVAGTNPVPHPHHRGDNESMFPAGRVFDAEQVRTGDFDNNGPVAIRLTLAEALTLQGFRPDYPVQGTRTKQFEQVGNAVPPPLAEAVLRAVI